jgi:hypothetical protein
MRKFAACSWRGHGFRDGSARHWEQTAANRSSCRVPYQRRHYPRDKAYGWDMHWPPAMSTPKQRLLQVCARRGRRVPRPAFATAVEGESLWLS